MPPGSWIQNAGGAAILGIKTLAQLFTPGLSWRVEFIRQYVFAFKVTLLPATIVAFVVGFSTIGIQGGSIASSFGAIDRISSAAPVAFLRELGPLLTAAIVAGSLGSTITAEIGARKIREEIMALELLGISPVRNLILPRVAGLCLWMPVLSLLTFWAGIAGTFTAAVFLYGGTPEAFFSELLSLTNFIDLWGSVVKLTLFGALIGITAAYKGLQVSGGAEGVGKAVNESVVSCLVVIGIVTVVYTQLFQAFFPEVNFGG
ncbi:MAG: phospholipid/cholesterol/gamma-HCH transport system permease protein [Thermoleophilaceae bacterium]|nr:phospholipid/cholesterol/gamma-HCH transport system permease protein [Thermoleophilaceae bacterium]